MNHVFVKNDAIDFLFKSCPKKITRFLALLQNLQLLEIEKKSQSAIQHPGKKLLEKLSNKLLEKLLSVNAPFQFLSFVFHVLYCLCFLFNMIL
jgi:hypothetical protein